MVVHIYNIITLEAETRGSEVQDRPWLYIEFKASLDYMRPVPPPQLHSQENHLLGS